MFSYSLQKSLPHFCFVQTFSASKISNNFSFIIRTSFLICLVYETSDFKEMRRAFFCVREELFFVVVMMMMMEILKKKDLIAFFRDYFVVKVIIKRRFGPKSRKKKTIDFCFH